MSEEVISEENQGTDVDRALNEAQDGRILNDWYGIKPGKLVTNEQIQRMQDHQLAMNQRDLTSGNSEDTVDIKPLDPEQQRQTEQSNDLEYLIGLFTESYDIEHQETAWKLFDEFIDSHSMTREQERALRII